MTVSVYVFLGVLCVMLVGIVWVFAKVLGDEYVEAEMRAFEEEHGAYPGRAKEES
jgi:hypothetical protein